MKRLREQRRGVTLMELLVVATIILIVTAVSVPTIKPMMESQLTKQAGSTVSTYLNRARARAMATGRPCGVTFEYFQGSFVPGGIDNNGDPIPDASASLVLHQVETPPFYSGLEQGETFNVFAEDDVFAQADPVGAERLRIRLWDTSVDPYWGAMVPKPSRASEDYGCALEVGAKIQFNGVGPFYPIVHYEGPGPSGAPVASYAVKKLPGIDLPVLQNATFKVVRQPRPTMTAPVGLPQGAVVDMEHSGTDDQVHWFGGESNVTVMFAPDGSVDRVEYLGGGFIPTEPIYFLIGRWERIAALGGAEDGLWNSEDPLNAWVAINPTSGLVTTAEVNPPFDYLVGDDEAPYGLIYESREFARMLKRNIGGR
ncbi:MAG: prepilin-type N-terminal cleavage/methylation domain-containing protein [Thermoguttaceae bacterium]|nr:prepilin-type N-terminal cleavage/methylation domain-containing protein [Thermoguttaceae bacterium]